MTSIIKRI